MLCKKCGESLEGVNICSKCGTKVPDAKNAENPFNWVKYLNGLGGWILGLGLTGSLILLGIFLNEREAVSGIAYSLVMLLTTLTLNAILWGMAKVVKKLYPEMGGPEKETDKQPEED